MPPTKDPTATPTPTPAQPRAQIRQLKARAATDLAVTFDEWVVEFSTSGTGAVAFGEPGPAPPVIAVARCTRSRVRPEDGVRELSPLTTDTVTVPIFDLFATADVDPAVATLINDLLALVEKYGTLQGLL